LHPPYRLFTVTFPNIFTYHPCYKLSYSQTLPPTIQTTWCNVPKLWKPSNTNFMNLHYCMTIHFSLYII